MTYSIDGFYADQNAGGQRIHKYTTEDAITVVRQSAYFETLSFVLQEGDKIAVFADSAGSGAWYLMTVSAVTVGSIVEVVQDVQQELLVTGAVQPGVQSVELNHVSTIIAATIATTFSHPGLFVVKDTSASGTVAHTLTLTAGTFDGTNNVVTLNAPNEALAVWFDSSGNGTIVENVGAVVLS